MKQCVTDYGYCVIVVSEGAADARRQVPRRRRHQGCLRPHAARRRRARWSPNMVREAHGYKYHWAVADYLQRAARHIASKVDVRAGLRGGQGRGGAGRQGRERRDADHRPQVLEALPVGHRPGAARARSPTRRRKCRATTSPRTASASPTACRRYLEPLIAGEDYPPYKNGLPDYVRIKGVPVKRKLEHRLQGLKREPRAEAVCYISPPFSGRQSR